MYMYTNEKKNQRFPIKLGILHIVSKNNYHLFFEVTFYTLQL